jgi:hypothetical protein
MQISLGIPMYMKKVRGPVQIELPNGQTLNRSDLPPPTTRRWVARRKFTVVQAVYGGLLTIEEACEMYDLSKEELSGWCDSAKSHGTSALKVTKIQKYRQPKVD